MSGGAVLQQQRKVDTPCGTFGYTLAHKKVKNMTLRIQRDGTIAMSVPLRCPPERADELVREKAQWLSRALERRSVPVPALAPLPAGAVCMALLHQALERMFPLVYPLGVSMPQLKLRAMRSQWGNCHWRQGYITLNTALSRCPTQLQDYVALHELVHFLHHNHGTGFYRSMDGLMPDWQVRRKALKSYQGALEP